MTERCQKCGQKDQGQTGEYPCPECGLPTVWDDIEDSLTIRECLAAYAHRAWAGWINYIFKVSTLNPDSTVTIPAWAVEGWKRQAKTPYNELSESEKESDRREADIMINLVSLKAEEIKP